MPNGYNERNARDIVSNFIEEFDTSQVITTQLYEELVRRVMEFGRLFSIERIARDIGIDTSNLRPRASARRSFGTYTLSMDQISNAMNVSEHVPEPEAISMEEVSSSSGISAQFEPVYFNEGRIEPVRRVRRRSENDMMIRIVRGDNFPRPNFKDWSSDRELQNIIDDWYRNVEYKDQWIFARREREGFNRRNIGHFHLDDVMARMTKRRNKNQLDTENSQFYDWKLGGTEWTLRLELFKHYQDGDVKYFLISRYIHKPSNVEIKFDIRYWSNSAEKFKSLYNIFSETRNNDTIFERIVGNSSSFDDFHEDDDRDYDEDYDGEDDDF